MPDRDTGGSDSPKPASSSPGSVVFRAHRAGEEVGRLSALAAFRFAELAASALTTISADGMGGRPPDGSGDRRPDDAPDASPLARAELIVGRAGHQASAMTAGMRERLMRSAALAREEAEDIMVDAQELRQRSRDDTTRAS